MGACAAARVEAAFYILYAVGVEGVAADQRDAVSGWIGLLNLRSLALGRLTQCHWHLPHASLIVEIGGLLHQHRPQ